MIMIVEGPRHGIQRTSCQRGPSRKRPEPPQHGLFA
jgi:hypothetical protein